MYSQNIYGTWLRPNELLYGIEHEKLFISEVLAHDTISWQTLRKRLSVETDTYILTNVIKDHVWNMQILSTDISAEPLFANSDINSYLEKVNLSTDIMWSRINDLRNMTSKSYEPNEIVWKAEKHWTYDSQYAKSDTIELTLWLDDFTVTENGDEVWTDSKTQLNSISRLAMKNYPYETTVWEANISVMFATSRQVYAMRNTNELMMSYIANDPLNIKYVIMKPFLKSTFNDMKSKEEEWSLQANYRKDNPYKLYGENNYFKDNSIY